MGGDGNQVSSGLALGIAVGIVIGGICESRGPEWGGKSAVG